MIQCKSPLEQVQAKCGGNIDEGVISKAAKVRDASVEERIRS